MGLPESFACLTEVISSICVTLAIWACRVMSRNRIKLMGESVRQEQCRPLCLHSLLATKACNSVHTGGSDSQWRGCFPLEAPSRGAAAVSSDPRQVAAVRGRAQCPLTHRQRYWGFHRARRHHACLLAACGSSSRFASCQYSSMQRPLICRCYAGCAICYFASWQHIVQLVAYTLAAIVPAVLPAI